ncbi:MAG: glucose-6-phosphate isomerase [bacterium]
MKEKDIKLDVNNMFEDVIGKEHGISKDTIVDFQNEANKIHEKIKKDRANGKMGFMELPAQSNELITEIEEEVEKREGYENFVVIGIGGSALGNIALQTALNKPYYNLDSKKRNGNLKLFVPDNVDPVRLKSLLDSLDLEKTLFNVITKSGSTAETMSQFLIAREAVAKVVGEDNLSDHFIATTSKDSGYLKIIAERENFKTFYIPENVGGRFSVLSPVGLISAAFCGINIRELLKGAATMAERSSTANLRENPAYLNALLHYLAYKQGKTISVMIPYAHQLKDMADWYRQLWAESLGKELNRDKEVVNVGPTPVKSLGATDQHSQAQLYMEGPYDKIITFIEVENFDEEVEIPRIYEDIEGVNYLGGHSLNELIKTEKKATELALTKRNRLNESIILPEINEHTIGQLIYILELQTAFAGELFNINAFNQPGVELGKNYTYGVLSRKGYDEMKKEYNNKPKKDENWII